MDIMVVEETTNKMFNVLYAQGSNNKFGVFGFRTGAYVAGKTNGIVNVSDMATTTEKLYLGYSDSLSGVESATKGAVYTLEITVSATEIGAVPTVKTVFDGVEIANTNTVGLKASKLGISAWKESTFGFDNIRVKNNDTGVIVFDEDFEENSTPPASGDEETGSNHTLTDNTLIKKYGLVCGSSDSTDGTNPDIAYAKIASADNNAYLESF